MVWVYSMSRRCVIYMAAHTVNFGFYSTILATALCIWPTSICVHSVHRLMYRKYSSAIQLRLDCRTDSFINGSGSGGAAFAIYGAAKVSLKDIAIEDNTAPSSLLQIFSMLHRRRFSIIKQACRSKIMNCLMTAH